MRASSSIWLFFFVVALATGCSQERAKQSNSQSDQRSAMASRGLPKEAITEAMRVWDGEIVELANKFDYPPLQDHTEKCTVERASRYPQTPADEMNGTLEKWCVHLVRGMKVEAGEWRDSRRPFALERQQAGWVAVKSDYDYAAECRICNSNEVLGR